MKNYFQIVKLMFTVDKKLLGKCMLVIILLLGLESAIPIYMEWMIDQVAAYKDILAFAGYVAVFIAASLGLCMLNALRTKLYEQLGRHILWKTREKIYRVLWNSNYDAFVRDNKEKLKFILSTESFTVYAVTTIYTVGIIIDVITIILFMIFSFIINSVVAIALLFSIAVTSVLSAISRREMLQDYQAYEDAKEADVICNHEAVDMTELIRTNGLSSYYLRRNEESINSFFAISMRANTTDSFWMTSEQSLCCVIFVLIAGVLVLTNSTGGQLVTILFITNYLLQQSQSLQRQVQVLIKNLPSFNKVMEVINIPLETGTPIEKIHSIVFNAVSLKYANGRDVFNNLSFCLETGDHALIEGVNGSGKSSILKMIVGLLSPTEGAIEVNGKSLNDYDHTELYKEICYISQDELFLNETVEDYLRIITHTDVTDDDISSLREKMHLSPEIDRITDNGTHLSGGEKKKLLLLKCMLRSTASVIILDEIDSGLDNETKELLHDIQEDILGDPSKIVIKISHIDTDRRGFNKITLNEQN